MPLTPVKPRKLRNLGLGFLVALVAAGAARADLPHDDCATATVVTDGTPAAEGDNSGANAVDDDEASCQLFSAGDVWFEYVATCDGQATVDTIGSGQADTVLSVYDACGGTEIACDDNGGPGRLSTVTFDVALGQSYWIRLASVLPFSPGDYDLNITCVGIPVNDDCASALLVSDGAPAAEGNNAAADASDAVEASCQPFADRDVWFEYVAGCNGAATIDTLGSGQLDTVLSVYDACGGNEIACDDNGGPDRLSEVTFDVAVGQSYWIRLASVPPFAPGDYDLNIACVGPPANDDCASAAVVTDGTPAAEGDNSQASETDDDEASCQPFADADVWFEYAATCDGLATIDTLGSGQSDTVLSVYDGCGGNEIACDDNGGPGFLSQVTFDVASGQSYWVRLASVGTPGDYDLNIACVAAPSNEDCASATVVGDGTPAAEGNNSAADPNDAVEASCQPFSDYDVWFEYVALCDGFATVDTFGSGQADTVLSVYDACGANEIACNDNTGGQLSQVVFDVAVGQSYWIRLASSAFDGPGDYDLNIACTAVAANDDCASAQLVTDGAPAAEGSNAAADPNDLVEASCQPFSDYDVWFEYVATCDGLATIDTVGSDQVGHASIATTVDVYGHLVPGSNRNAVNRLDDPEEPAVRLVQPAGA
ncbi:MAG: hypothetical protein GY778_04610 [bacterium]|nr:hypothetical protein [bacterium]